MEAPVSKHQPELIAQTIRVVLHGHLRRKFGPEFNLGVSSPASAINALIALVPGFRAALQEGEYRVRRGTYRKGVDLPLNGLGLRIVPGGEMHIIPAAKGAKRGGGGKVIVGALMVVAAVLLMQPEIAAGVGLMSAGEASFLTAAGVSTLSMGAPLVGGFTIGSLALAGGALMLGGILQMISPQPKSNNTQATQSFLASGQGNTVHQGVPVPVVYGRTRVGSVVASVGYSAEEFSPDGTLMQPATSGGGYAPTTTGGAAPDGAPTEAIGTTGPVDDGVGSYANTGGGGGGKSGGGSSGGAHEDADTLHSKATVRIIDILGEGPIGGLVDGAKSIFFNGVALQASDGTYNFKGVTWEVRYGYPDQDPVAGFPAAENSQPVGIKVYHADPVVQTISSSTATAARVTIRIPAMYARDPNSGNIQAAPELNYKIEVRPSQSGSPGWIGSWQEITDVHIVGGKTMSAYQRSHRFNLPLDNGANTWDIRLTRNTADSTDITNLQNDIYFDLLDTIDDHRLIYPNTAYIALTFDAKTFGTSIPSRQYEIYGRQIQVPLNYDPSSRTYATSGAGTSGGTWDLSSTHSLPSDNPAFVLLDMLSHTRYGCAIKAQYLETVRASLYNIAQYCDGSVPDGFGGYEPRYSVNVVIATQDDAYRVLQYMVSAFRGMSYWGAGQVMVTADMPEDPVKLVNQTNVLDGDFSYESTSHKTRHNLVRVAYVDKTNRYLPSYELVPDTIDIAKRGVVPTDIVAWGCTSRSLARRLGKWMLYTELRQTETVTYKAGAYHTDVRPNDKLLLSDPAYVGARYAGRLRPGTVSSGWNWIANSGSPGPVPVSPNTVSTTTAVAEKVHTVTRYAHSYAHGASTDCGTVSVTVGPGGAGVYVLSCYVWIPSAFTGTAVSLTSDVTIDASDYSVGTDYGAGIEGPGGVIITFATDLPATNVADLSKRDQWQRIYFRATYAIGNTALARLTVTGGSAQTVYSTAWQIEGGTEPSIFVLTSGGNRVIRELWLDSVFVQDGSATYTISVLMPDGGIDAGVPIEGFVLSDTDPQYTIAQLSRPLAQTPSRNAEWIITTANLSPRQFQVLALGEDGKGVFSVTAVEYDPNKFAEVELGIEFDDPNYSRLPELLLAPLPPPTNVAARDYITGIGVTQVIRVTVSWTAPLDPRVTGFQIMASSDGFFQTWSAAWATSYDIDALPAGGVYNFGVRSVSQDGKTSEWAFVTTPITVDGKIDPPAAPGGLVASGGTRRVNLTWTPVANRRDIIQYEVWRSGSPSIGPGAGATAIGASTGFSFSDADGDVLLPLTTWYYWVRAIAQGTPLVYGAFAGPVGATTTQFLVDDIADGIINTAKFASNIKPVLLIPNLSASATVGAVAFNTADEQLYKYTGSGWTPYIDLATITGELDTTKLVGTITETQIADGSIKTPKLYAGAVTGDKIAANTITGGNIQALQISAGHIAANAVEFGKIAAGAVRADQIYGGEIRAWHLATETIISNFVQIAAGTIVNAHITDLSVTNAKIDNLTIGTGKISNNAITEAPSVSSSTPATITTGTNSDVLAIWVTVPADCKVILLVKCVVKVDYIGSGGTPPGESGGT